MVDAAKMAGHLFAVLQQTFLGADEDPFPFPFLAIPWVLQKDRISPSLGWRGDYLNGSWPAPPIQEAYRT